MNKDLQNYARETILDGLADLPASWQNMFKRMYAGPIADPETLEGLDLKAVVDDMDEECLDRAMEQVKASLKKLEDR